MKVKRIPFDSLCLAQVVKELQPWVGAELTNVVNVGETSVVLVFFSKAAGQGALLLDVGTQFPRAHMVTRRLPEIASKRPLIDALKSKVVGTVFNKFTQVNLDRILKISLGDYEIIGEFMGRNSNLILTNSSGTILAAQRLVSPSQSPRPISIGKKYELPPGSKPIPALTSPFWESLLEKNPNPNPTPTYVPGYGAYPYDVQALGYENCVPRTTYSLAAEQAFNEAIESFEFNQTHARLYKILDRVHFARETALKDLQNAELQAKRAGHHQMLGELILAFGPSQPFAKQIEAMDYEGNTITIPVDPELTPAQNAEIYFQKAKKAKAGKEHVQEQTTRIESQLEEIRGALYQLEKAKNLEDLKGIEDLITQKRWAIQSDPKAAPEASKYGSFKVKELIGPHGFVLLYGENATSNDFLTMRVARPDDWWLHVRGQTSAHVIIPTGKKPEKVPYEVLKFAAGIAAKNSVAKHSKYVEVDYTLRKFVRKPKGSPIGTVFYTREKTIIVEQ